MRGLNKNWTANDDEAKTEEFILNKNVSDYNVSLQLTLTPPPPIFTSANWNLLTCVAVTVDANWVVTGLQVD